jgi:DNA processing protein
LSSDLSQLLLQRLLCTQPRKLNRLLSRYGSAESVLGSEPALRQQITPETDSAARADLTWLDESSHHLIHRDDPDFPEQLRAISDPPLMLFGRGDRSALSVTDHRIAMVGARKASRYGIAQAETMAAELAAAGMSVVSGLALGIDAAAHEGALAGSGVTIAVLGCGIDQVYPKRHWRLAERIEREGLILSEFPRGVEALPSHFPQRNRIVTGLCQATLVVEAATGSGSLISASLAASEGREVMAMPGLITNQQARGCHQLIRDGALLIESASDVLRELGLAGQTSLLPDMPVGGLQPEQHRLLAHLGEAPKSIDELICEAEFTLEEVTVNLVTLEVLGLVTSEAGCYQRSPVAKY